MKIRSRGRRLVARLESLETVFRVEPPYEIRITFSDDEDAETIRLFKDGDRVVVLDDLEPQPAEPESPSC